MTPTDYLLIERNIETLKNLVSSIQRDGVSDELERALDQISPVIQQLEFNSQSLSEKCKAMIQEKESLDLKLDEKENLRKRLSEYKSESQNGYLVYRYNGKDKAPHFICSICKERGLITPLTHIQDGQTTGFQCPEDDKHNFLTHKPVRPLIA